MKNSGRMSIALMVKEAAIDQNWRESLAVFFGDKRP